MYIIRGKVITGKKRGNTLGFPTANLRLHKEIPQGIYVSTTKIEGVGFHSATFVGHAATFNEKKAYVETFILNFNKNIYNRYLTVTLHKKIRENEKFESVENLVAQIKKDIKKVEEYFKNV